MPETYDANLTVERMRARRRMKLLTRAKRRAEQQGKKAIDRVRHSSDTAKKIETLQKHTKKIEGLTKMRDMLAGFLEDTAAAHATWAGRSYGKAAVAAVASNGMTHGTVYTAAASGASIARDVGNEALAAELDKHPGECVAITDGKFVGVVRDE